MDEHAEFETQAVLPPRRKRGNAMGVLIAGVAVMVTVGAGFLGGVDSPIAPRATDAAAAADIASPDAFADASPRPTTAPGPRYPSDVLGLKVWSAAYVSTYGVAYFGTTVAVAGWYAAEPGTGCPTPRVAEDPSLAEEFGVAGDANTFCHRTGELFTAPMFDENIAPIGVELRPGVAAPYELKDATVVTPVVLVGKLLLGAPACHAPGTCPRNLVVDSVAWADGTSVARTSSVLPRLLAHWPPLGSPTRDQLAADALGYPGTVLLETLVDQATLARIDDEAATVVASEAPKAERIWYRRVLGPDPNEDALRWVAIDDATGELIATGLS